ncbi:unnamed protein product [Boreogadus saida]
MELETNSGDHDDNRNSDPGCLSIRSKGKDSPASTGPTPKHGSSVRDRSQDRSKTRIWEPDPDRDVASDGRASGGEGRGSAGSSLYSDDYESRSSGRSLSPHSRSRTPSRTSPRGPRTNGALQASPFRKTGGGGVRRGVTRPQRHGGPPSLSRPLHRGGGGGGGGRSLQSKEPAAPKDLDLVTKRMLSARLLKINELRNALSELQLRMDELQKENRVLRQLQVRQEKALHRYDDTESEISQLLTRHSNETTSLRERLRRAQERERASERRLKDAEERLQRSQAAEARLRRLAEKQELGPREELSRQLEQEKSLGQEAQRRIKELQRGLELSNSSYQRQLAAERKKVVGVQEEMRTLQEELVRLSAKLKEKERELDTMNIYANRVMKPSARKDTDLGAKGRAPSITKAVQTEERPSSPGFPTPPPAAIADGNEYANRTPDNLSFKELQNDRRGQEGSRERRDEDHQEREMAKGRGREKEEKRPQKLFSNGPELKPKRSEEEHAPSTGREKEEKSEPATLNHKLDDKRQRRGPLREEVEKEEVVVEKEEEVVVGSRWNQEEAEEERRRKDHLLAKLREIDLQKEPSPPDPVFSDRDPRPVPHQHHHHHHHAASGPPPPHSLNAAAIFSFTALEESAGATHTTQGGGDGGRKGGEGVAGAGRRGLPRPQVSDPDDLTFGSYAPTIGRPPARGSISGGFPSPPPPPREGDKERERSAGSSEGRNSVSLMEQLFGTLATPPAQISSSSNRMAALASESRPRREKLFGPEAAAPGAFQGTLHVAESRPAVRAIASFDDDIEELTL